MCSSMPVQLTPTAGIIKRANPAKLKPLSYRVKLTCKAFPVVSKSLHYRVSASALSGDMDGASKIRGVNYGSRFIPEDWMASSPYEFFQGICSPEGLRQSLCDVVDTDSCSARERMMKWLDATIQEAHFQEMKQMGVQVVRVPCGYWNWVTCSTRPEAIAGRLGNLCAMAPPDAYLPFFDKIFLFAERNEIRVLLDLHALPGSQNGEMHSGACLTPGSCQFLDPWNVEQAVEAVGRISEYAAGKSNIFGVQVINEPQISSSSFDELVDYYKRSILKAREFLPMETPVVVFEWTNNFDRWKANFFDSTVFGNVLWDTHLYHFPGDGESWSEENGGLSKAQNAYKEDLLALARFQRLGNRAFVGEFSLAGPSLSAEGNRELSQWLVSQIYCVSQGAIFWNFDHPSINEWSFSRCATELGIDWPQVMSWPKVSFEGPPVALQSWDGRWLRAGENGEVTATAEKPSAWEEWTPHYLDAGQRVALRSFHGRWLRADEQGSVAATAEKPSAWETWTPLWYEADGLQKLALQSFHGRWLKADPIGDVSASATDHSKWEEWSGLEKIVL